MGGNDRGWSPYLAGALSGLLIVFSVLIAGKYFGASTAFVRSAGMLEKIVSPDYVTKVAYFIKKSPKLDWQWMFVVGIMVGSFLSSIGSGTLKIQTTPIMWRSRFGNGIGKRFLVAFVGGIVAMFGARLAGGCPSGHGLSGVLQLSLSGFVAVSCFFIGGIIVARLIYGRS